MEPEASPEGGQFLEQSMRTTIQWMNKGLMAGCLSSLMVFNPGGVWADGHSPVSAPLTQGTPATPDTQLSRRGVDQTLALIREASWALLKEGNQRFVEGRSRHPNLDGTRRSLTVSDGQKPFATILSCSDSRSPVELIFDRGVGDLFVVRVAGNVADESQIATIEYGAEHLGTPLLVVLGHTGCGAVGAACKGGHLPGHLPALIQRIQPAVEKARAVAVTPDKLVPTAIQANVWLQIEEIVFQSGIVREKLKDGSLQVVGGIYDLEKGTVTWLGTHPSLDGLISKAETAEKESALARAAGTKTDATSHGDHADAEPSEAQERPFKLPALFPTREVKARSPKAEPEAHEPQEHPHH